MQRAELDWLIYNEPLTYAQLVLAGEIETYFHLLNLNANSKPAARITMVTAIRTH